MYTYKSDIHTDKKFSRPLAFTVVESTLKTTPVVKSTLNHTLKATTSVRLLSNLAFSLHGLVGLSLIVSRLGLTFNSRLGLTFNYSA